MQYILLLFFISLFVSQSALDVFWTLGALGGIWLFVKNKEKWQGPWLWFAAASGFWLVSIISRLVNSSPSDWGPMLENRWGLEAFFFILFARRIKGWFKLFEWMAWVFSIIQVIAFFWFYFFQKNPQPFTERFGGLFPNPLFWAETTSVMGLFFLGLALFAKETGRAQKSFILASLIAFAALLMTQTRGSWIGYFVALPIYLYVWNPRRFALHFLGLIVLTLAIGFSIKPLRERVAFTAKGLEGQETYDTERRALWKANWMMFKDHPILGVGFGENKAHLQPYFDQMQLPENQFKSHAHNQYLQVLGGTGVLGFITYLATLLSIIFYSWKISKSSNAKIRAVGWSCVGSMVFFMIASLTEANFNIAKTRYALFFIWVIVLAFWPRQHDSAGTVSDKGSL